jgi:tungstate transport system ATP-binding protein
MGLSLEASHLYKTYNGQPALTDCSWFFNSGLTYALLGPNGSGKSTLFRILALLEAPDAGQVGYLDNHAILKTDLNLRRKITLLLPHIGVFNTTVFKNVAYGLKIRGLRPPEIEGRVSAALAAVGLGPKRSQQALGLSSGETKRLGIARALVIKPEVFFLDEPTANIDPVNTEIIEAIILKLKQQRDTTIIMITHDPAQGRRLADQVLVMNSGRILPDASEP